MRAGSRAAKSVLETEEIDPLDISASSAFWKTPAQDLDEPARSGWLEKEGHVVQNWKRRWFVLWPASGSKWAAKHNETKWAERHGRDRTQQPRQLLAIKGARVVGIILGEHGVEE